MMMKSSHSVSLGIGSSKLKQKAKVVSHFWSPCLLNKNKQTCCKIEKSTKNLAEILRFYYVTTCSCVFIQQMLCTRSELKVALVERLKTAATAVCSF